MIWHGTRLWLLLDMHGGAIGYGWQVQFAKQKKISRGGSDVCVGGGGAAAEPEVGLPSGVCRIAVRRPRQGEGK